MRLTSRLLETCLKAGLSLVAVLAGCGTSYPGSDAPLSPGYGIEPPSTAPDPDLRLLSLTYTPGNPVTADTLIVFTATANHYSPNTAVRVTIGDDPAGAWGQSLFQTILYDNGQAPDQVAGDAVYTGSLRLPGGLASVNDLPVIARVNWWSKATPPSIAGEPLDILAAGE